VVDTHLPSSSLDSDLERISQQVVSIARDLKVAQSRSSLVLNDMDRLREENDLLRKQLVSLGVEPCVAPFTPSAQAHEEAVYMARAATAHSVAVAIDTASTAEVKINPFSRSPSSPTNAAVSSSLSVASASSFGVGVPPLPSYKLSSAASPSKGTAIFTHKRTGSGSLLQPPSGGGSVSSDKGLDSPSNSITASSLSRHARTATVDNNEENRKSTHIRRTSGIFGDDDLQGPLNFEEDSPMFTDTLKNLQESNETLAKKMKTTLKAVHQLVAHEAAAEKEHFITPFSQALTQLLDDSEDKNVYARTLTQKEPLSVDALNEGVEILGVHLGRVVHHLSENFYALLKNFDKNLSDPLDKYNRKVKELPTLCKEYMEKQDVYEEKMRSFLLFKRKEKAEKIAEKEAEIQAARRDFELSRFKYVRYLNELEMEKRSELMLAFQMSLAEFIHFFTSGNELCQQYQDSNAVLGRKLLNEKLNAKECDRKWTLLKQEIEVVFSRGAFPVDAENRRKKAISIFTTSSEFKGWKGVVHQGYLYKRSSSIKKDWKKRWFVMHGGCLYYYQDKGKKKSTAASQLRKFAKSIDIQMNEMEKVCDIMLCTVKICDSPSDVRFCFEIISPGSRTYMLQAENENDFDKWVTTIRGEIEARLGSHNNVSSNRMNSMSFRNPDKLLAMNRLIDSSPSCADCFHDNPDWAVINLGITVCINCSGVHRNLGTHISKVRSLSLDEWRLPLLNLMLAIGNYKSNEIWCPFHEGGPSIAVDCERSEREKFIRNKYEKKVFINSIDAEELKAINQNCFDAASNDDLMLVILYAVNGADINWKNEEGKSILHIAVEHDNGVIVEWLCQNGADCKILDSNGLTPMECANEDIKSILLSHIDM
jgi:hypothetical protein